MKNKFFTDKIISRAEAQIVAVKSGKSTLPISHKDNDIEQAIAHALSKEIAETKAETIESVRDVYEHFVNVEVNIDKLKDIYEAFKNEIKARALSGFRLLKTQSDKFSEIEYKITARMAILGKSRVIFEDRKKLAIQTATIAFIEGTFNALSIVSGQAYSGGIFGAIFLSAIVGIVNIALGYLTGDYLYRYRESFLMKIMLSATTIFTLIINTTFGAIRNGSSWSSFSLVDPENISVWLFVLVGLLIYIFVSMKWYRSRDSDVVLYELVKERDQLGSLILTKKQDLSDVFLDMADDSIDEIEELLISEASDVSDCQRGMLDLSEADAIDSQIQVQLVSSAEGAVERLRAAMKNSGLALPSFYLEHCDFSRYLSPALKLIDLSNKLTNTLIPQYERMIGLTETYRGLIRSEVNNLLTVIDAGDVDNGLHNENIKSKEKKQLEYHNLQQEA